MYVTELKWFRGNPHDYSLESGSTVYIIAKRNNKINFLRSIYYYFDECPACKTQEERNLFSHTGCGEALDNFRISEVLCFLPIHQKEILISDALKCFPDLKNTIESNKKENLVTVQHDYRFDLYFDD